MRASRTTFSIFYTHNIWQVTLQTVLYKSIMHHTNRPASKPCCCLLLSLQILLLGMLPLQTFLLSSVRSWAACCRKCFCLCSHCACSELVLLQFSVRAVASFRCLPSIQVGICASAVCCLQLQQLQWLACCGNATFVCPALLPASELASVCVGLM